MRSVMVWPIAPASTATSCVVSSMPALRNVARTPAPRSTASAFRTWARETGTSGAKRSENVKINLAAVIVEVLPNGNLVIAGKQELRVNQEMRDIQLTGIIRSQDIEPNNTVSSDKIAEGRISYGGRGLITDYQAPSYGQQMIEILRPF